MITQYIPDLVGEVVAKTATALKIPVYYDWGHYSEVVKNLDEKDKSVTNKAKYPLIWLVMDFEQIMNPKPGIYADANLQLILATNTSINYNMRERADISFLPTLYPIYWELINQFSNSRVLSTNYVLKHSLWERPYWGVEGKSGNGGNLFNDFVDALQIKNFPVSVKKAC